MTRLGIAVGMLFGVAWAVAIVLGPLALDLPFVPPALAIPAAFLIPGVVMMAMIAVSAASTGSRADIDARVLQNTTEQMVLALLVWPFIGFSLGGVSIIALGVGMAVARLIYWVGCHIAAPLRAFGFAASFCPTIFGAIWAVWIWVN